MVNTNNKYVCNLSNELIEKAKRELNEDPERRAEDIETLRQWVQKQPHIHGQTDVAFLLTFLRSCKFSIEQAKEKIDRYYTLKTAIPEWFTGMDLNKPEFQQLLNSGFCISLGYSKQGQRVILRRLGDNLNKQGINYVHKLGHLCTNYIAVDEQTQICGCIIITDLDGLMVSIIGYMTPSVIKKIMAIYQNATPLRVKASHVINASAIFDTMYQIMKGFMKEKFIKRTKFHGSDLDSLHKEVPRELLPTEYGGTAGDLSKCIAKTVNEIMEYRDYFIEQEQYLVDESKRPGKPKTPQDLFGMDGTFRKLNLD